MKVTSHPPRLRVYAVALAVLMSWTVAQPAAADDPDEVTLTWSVPAWPDWLGDLEVIVDGHEVLSEELLISLAGMGETLEVSLSNDLGDVGSPKVVTDLCPGKKSGLVVKFLGLTRGTNLEVTYSHASHQYRTAVDGVDVVVRVCERIR